MVCQTQNLKSTEIGILLILFKRDGMIRKDC